MKHVAQIAVRAARCARSMSRGMIFTRLLLIGAVPVLCAPAHLAPLPLAPVPLAPVHLAPVPLAPVHLAFAWPSAAPASTPIHIHATRMVGDSTGAVPVDADVAPSGAVLDLGEGIWQVQAFAAGYWSPGAEVTVDAHAPLSAQIPFFPAATLRGEFAAPQSAPPLESLDVELTAKPASAGPTTNASPQPGSAHLICPVDGKAWSCLAPAGLFDVRLEAPGYASVYDWAVTLQPAESTDLGQSELQNALSVFGRAVGRDGSDPPGPCLATLDPDAQRSGGPEPQPQNAPANEKSFTVPVGPRGFFQIVGVQPGRHVLTVQCLAASGFAELEVQPEGETRIDSPLVLQDLALDIALTPAADPAGQPWKLTVDATSPRLRRIADSATPSADGRWTRRGLMAGSYRVTVSSSDGTPWLKQDFDLHADSGPLALRLASVSVAGQVLLNAQPVRARLLFSNQAGGDPVTLSSDDQGRFKGVLPVAPDAHETLWTVEAHLSHPATIRRLENVAVPKVAAGASAWLDLELPTIPVRGAVLSEDNQPQNNAQVTLEAAGSGFRTTTSADGEGAFEMADLPAGKYNAVAESDYGISEPTPFSVTGNSESQLKLILHPYLHIPFYVVSSDKEPIADATVQVWVAPGVPRALGRTDQNGRFEVSLPPGTTEVALTVGAPDYNIKLTKMPIASTPSANESDPSPQQNVAQSIAENTVTLDTNGGTLVLNFEPADGTLDRSSTLYLVHNGALADARTLSGWDTDQPGVGSDGPAEIDGIEPGDYALCVVTGPSQLDTLWQGAVPQASCTVGAVKAGQTLTLTPQLVTATAQ
jgi:hypothetical protein